MKIIASDYKGNVIGETTINPTDQIVRRPDGFYDVVSKEVDVTELCPCDHCRRKRGELRESAFTAVYWPGI